MGISRPSDRKKPAWFPKVWVRRFPATFATPEFNNPILFLSTIYCNSGVGSVLPLSTSVMLGSSSNRSSILLEILSNSSISGPINVSRREFPPKLNPLPPKRNPPPSTLAVTVTPGETNSCRIEAANSLLVVFLCSWSTNFNEKLPALLCSTHLLLPIFEMRVSISGFDKRISSKVSITSRVVTSLVPS